MKYAIYFLVFISFSIVEAQSPVIHFSFNNSTGDQTTLESVAGTNYSVTNHFSRPEFITALDGQALRMDGWSTFITTPSFSIPGITRQLTIEAWYSTEAFTNQPASIFDLTGGSDGVYLGVGPYGEVNLGYFVDGNFYLHTTPQHLAKYQWHHLVSVIDLNSGSTKIYVDNALWYSKTDLSGSQITLAPETLFIGKRNLDQTFTGFSLNTINGAIDDIRVYNVALDSATISAHFESAGDRTVELTIDPQVRYAGDYLRPQYHPIPNAVWANECYGLLYYNDKYHLFFQKNPNGPYLYFMHWGHLISDDLVNWTEERIAIAPDASPGFDNFGTWSGTTALGSDGIARILYTGVNTQKAAIGLALPADSQLLNWTKHANNPVIPGAPGGTMDFRDTYVWKDGSSYYMIVGSGISGNAGGAVYCYKSADLTSWNYLGPFYSDNNTSRSGTFWEMPFFFKIDATTYILGVNPVPTSTTKAVTLYWLGTWANEKFTPYDVTPKKLEFIAENMLAPAFGRDKDGNPALIGIIPEDRAVADQVAAGWRQTFSLAREPRLLKDSTVAEIPYRNLCSLRGATISLQNRAIKTGTNFNIPEFAGTQIELQFSIKTDSSSIFSIQVFKNSDGKEFTTLKFDLTTNSISLDKRFSTYSNAVANLRTESYVFDSKDTLNVRMFLDHSTLEVFVDNLIVISSRVYPSRPDDNKVDVVLNAGILNIVSAQQWTLYSTGQSPNVQVCVPENLPTSLHMKKKPDTVTGLPENQADDLELFPNPSSDRILIRKTGEWSAEFHLYSLTGQQVLTKDISNSDGSIQVSHLMNGVYIGQSLTAGRVQYFKIIIQH